MGGNSGTCPLDYYDVNLPTFSGGLVFLASCILWPITLVVVLLIFSVKFITYIITLNNNAIPRFIRFIFAWPFYLVSYMFGNKVVVEK